MDPPQLIISKNGKKQLYDQGYTFYIDKSSKDKYYCRCTHKKPTQCKARAVMKGDLEAGNFEVLSHDAEKHIHDKNPTDLLLKNFHCEFKRLCVERIDTSVQKVYEDLKISFTSSLTPIQKSSFLSKLPPPKGYLMVGYRARGADYLPQPKTVAELVIPERFAYTLDGERLDRGKTPDNCHLIMSKTQCVIAGLGKKWWIDATYLSAPVPVPQVLITRTRVEGKAYTTSYTLMPDKKKSTYVSALQQIKDTCAREGVLLQFT